MVEQLRNIFSEYDHVGRSVDNQKTNLFKTIADNRCFVIKQYRPVQYYVENIRSIRFCALLNEM